MLYDSGLASFGISYIVPSVLIFFFLLTRYAIIAHSTVITTREVPVVMDRIITATGTHEHVCDPRC